MAQVIYEDIPTFILGDSAYANLKHMVTTFKITECRNDEVIAALNKRLGGARYHVENAFGILKARFRIFQRPLECASRNVCFAILLIAAIFVVHNFLINVEDELPADLDVIESDENEVSTRHDLDEIEFDETTSTRNTLLPHIRWTLESSRN